MPIDPVSTTSNLMEYGALGSFILFLISFISYREWAHCKEKKETKGEKDDLIKLLTDCQNKRIEEGKEFQKDMFGATQILSTAMETINAMTK